MLLLDIHSRLDHALLACEVIFAIDMCEYVSFFSTDAQRISKMYSPSAFMNTMTLLPLPSSCFTSRMYPFSWSCSSCYLNRVLLSGEQSARSTIDIFLLLLRNALPSELTNFDASFSMKGDSSMRSAFASFDHCFVSDSGVACCAEAGRHRNNASSSVMMCVIFRMI